MRKRFLKGMLCAALSLSMALGSVMVGAAEKTEVPAAKITEGLLSLPQTPKVQLPKSSSKTLTKSGAQTVNAATFWTLAQWGGTNWPEAYVSGIAEESGNLVVGYVKASANGTLIVNAAATVNGANSTITLRETNGTYIGADYGSGIWKANAQANATYVLTVYASKGSAIRGAYNAGLVPSANNRTITSGGILTASTGANNYQYFKMSKKGRVAFGSERITSSGGPYTVKYYIQKKSGSSWKTVVSTKYEDAAYYGLDKGTYRVVSSASAGNIMALAAQNKYYYSSYGTKKSKAKTISRKKNKKNTLLTTDKAGKAHWYKIKVTKTRSTQIDIKSLGSSGNIYARVSGKSRLKTKKTNGNLRIYGKAKKGTYYIKIYKASKSTSGSYQVKYTK